MADHLHNTRDLICRDDAPPFTFSSNLVHRLMFFRLENGRLVQTNRRSMYSHIGEDDVWVCNALRQAKRVRE